MNKDTVIMVGILSASLFFGGPIGLMVVSGLLTVYYFFRIALLIFTGLDTNEEGNWEWNPSAILIGILTFVLVTLNYYSLLTPEAVISIFFVSGCLLGVIVGLSNGD